MKKFKVILILVFFLGILLRIWNLSADPSILLDGGQVGDEGYWLYNARNLSLFAKTASDDFYHDFAAAPIFSFVSFLSFSVFGVGFWQARLVSAISGIITLFLAYLIAKRLGTKVAVLTTFLLGINTMLLLHSRLAVGESLAIMFTTAGFYFLINNPSNWRLRLSGGFFALSLLAKTTSFLYLPSALLLLVSNYKDRKTTVAKFNNFATSFSFLFIIIFGFLLLGWGRQILLIYTTFGEWYAPRTFMDIWQNLINFFLHPFWGSPFLFSLLVLASLNSLNFLLDKRLRTPERKSLILWILGIFVLGPLIPRLSNARLLGLIVPIAILAAQTAFEPQLVGIRLDKISSFFKLNKLLLSVFILIVDFPLSVIIGKIILAVLKRITGDQLIVYKIPYVSVFLLFLFSICAFKNREILKKIIKFDLYLLLFLPIAAFIPLFWGHLSFFGISPPVETILVSVLEALSFIIFSFFIMNTLNLTKMITPLLTIYIFFNLLGILTIFNKPTYNIRNAADKLGQIVGQEGVIGFYAHELAIGNKLWPIYWAPGLNYVRGVNDNYQKYNPKFLLVVNTFDSVSGSLEAWPDTERVNRKTEKVTSFDLSRSFWKARRDFTMTLYKLVY